MSNELIPAGIFGAVTTQVGSDEDFADLSNSSNFLRRLELKSKGALIDKGLVRPGHYCVPTSSDKADDLGDTVDLLILARKPKAIDMSDKDAVVVTYDRQSEVFKDIERRAAQPNSHCQFGATFLVIERSTAQMYELFLGSASARREIATLSDYMPLSAEQIESRKLKGVKPHGPLPLTLKSERVENKKNGWSWFVPVPVPCSNPITADQIPSADAIKAELEKFAVLEEAQEVETQDAGKKKRAR